MKNIKNIKQVCFNFGLTIVLLILLTGCEKKNPEIELSFGSLTGKTEITSAEMLKGTDKALPEDISDEEDALYISVSTKGLEGDFIKSINDPEVAMKDNIFVLYNEQTYPLKNVLMSYTAGKGVETLTFVFYVPLNTAVSDCTLRINDKSGQRDYSISNKE